MRDRASMPPRVSTHLLRHGAVTLFLAACSARTTQDPAQLHPIATNESRPPIAAAQSSIAIAEGEVGLVASETPTAATPALTASEPAAPGPSASATAPTDPSTFPTPRSRKTGAADRARFIRDADALCGMLTTAGKERTQRGAAERLVQRIKKELGEEMQTFLGWLPGQTLDARVKYALIVREVEAHGRVGWSCPSLE